MYHQDYFQINSVAEFTFLKLFDGGNAVWENYKGVHRLKKVENNWFKLMQWPAKKALWYYLKKSIYNPAGS